MMMYPVRPVLEITTAVNAAEAVRVRREQLGQQE